MTYSWLAYLPPHLASDLLAQPNVSPLDRVLRQQAVALFADISGFTPMSEALGQVGPKGTEELSQILNRTFGTMIARITAAGGSIGKFAGDALTVVFPTTARTHCTTLRRALQCALDMQADLATTPSFATSAGSFSLTMKIGIGVGNLLTTTVGDEAIRLEYLIAGSAIEACAAAEHAAPKGAVVLPETLLPLVGHCTTSLLADGYHQIVRLHRHPPAAPCIPPVALAPPSVPTLTRYLPPAIAQRVARGQQGLIDEHRLVTTLFVRFAGFDYQDAAALSQLQAYLRAVVQISDRYGGYLRQVDVGDKGNLFIVLFGTPIAHEDDAERALRCALDLRALAQQHQIATASGITTGKVFCGLVGSDIRREYAAIGDSVNLAARLMSAAQPEQILVDAATQQSAVRDFQWYDLPPLTVKGKSAPIPVASLKQLQQRSATRLKAPSYTLPMIGRHHEYAIGNACVTRVVAGHSQVLLITAEAGMGKSRLIAELMRSTAIKQLRAITSECLSYGIDSSYLVWHTLLRTLFHLTPGMSSEAQVTQVATVIAGLDQTLLARMPLLDAILALPFAESDFTRTLDAKVRKSAREALVVELLRHWAQQQPLLLVLEDCHWIDALSEELLLAVAHGCRDVPLFLLLTSRPQLGTPQGGRSSGAQLTQLSDVQHLPLLAFTTEETAALIQLKLERLFGDTGSIPPTLLERITAIAQGNPFYIDELLNLLHDKQIDIRDPHALAQLELPTSLQRLILSRIDALEEGPKTALKIGSIIGRLFKAHWLHAIYPALGTEGRVAQYLTLLEQTEMTQLERAEPEVEYLFKHIITRDVAYESLALQTRTTLHEQVALFIEQTYQHELERWLDVLAYHYGHSSNVEKQREYFAHAARAAKAVFANDAALSYYERLLQLLPTEEHGEVLLELAEVEERLWQWDRAAAHAYAAYELAQQRSDRLLAAQAARLQGMILCGAGHYEQALTMLEQARHTFTQLDALPDLVRTLNVISLVHSRQGHHTEMAVASEACLDLATQIDDQEGCCLALSRLGVLATDRWHLHEAISCLERALAIAEAAQFAKVRAQLLGYLSVAYGRLGDHASAHTLQWRTWELALALGLQRDAVVALGNLGSIYNSMGQYRHAQHCIQAALARMQVLDPILIGWLLVAFAQTLQWLAEDAWVLQLYDRAIAVCRAFNIRMWLLQSLYNRAVCTTGRQEHTTAQAYNAEALQLADELQTREFQLLTRLLALQVQIAQQQIAIADAVDQLHALHSLATEPKDQALLAYTAWQFDPLREADRRSAAERYRALYTQTPDISYAQRYRELTGDALPPLPTLPAPPPIIDQAQLDLPAFLARVDALLARQERTN